MSKLLKDATATFDELLRMHKLNQELLETLTVTMMWIAKYAKKHDIPILNEPTYISLINKANALIEEIASKDKTESSDEFLHGDKSDEDFTEPLFETSVESSFFIVVANTERKENTLRFNQLTK